jgi:hypothetical protein
VRAALVQKSALALEQVDRRGLSSFKMIEGTIGADARAMGAASLPMLANFAVDRDVLFRETA